MGAGASCSTFPAITEEQYDEAGARALFGAAFDAEAFHSAAADDGTVTQDQIMGLYLIAASRSTSDGAPTSPPCDASPTTHAEVARAQCAPSTQPTQPHGPSMFAAATPQQPCPHCGRSFREEILQRHAARCTARGGKQQVGGTKQVVATESDAAEAARAAKKAKSVAATKARRAKFANFRKQQFAQSGSLARDVPIEIAV